MSEPIGATVRRLDPGEVVDLFTIDLTTAGYMEVLHFTPSDPRGGSLWFGGVEYLSLPIQITGFGKDAQNAPPEPTMTIGNVDKGGNALLSQYNSLLQAKVTRTRTFSKFLDKLPDGTTNPNADSTAFIMPEIWYVEQKQTANRSYIQWRLRSAIDLGGKQIPARLILKNVCRRNYRSYDGTSFVYPTKNACPYHGAQSYTLENTATADPSLDSCRKDFTACKLRFGSDPLPGWFFPGVSRTPQR